MSAIKILLSTTVLFNFGAFYGGQAAAMEPAPDSPRFRAAVEAARAGPVAEQPAEAAAQPAEPGESDAGVEAVRLGATNRIIVKYREGAPEVTPEMASELAETFTEQTGRTLRHLRTSGTADDENTQVLVLDEPVSLDEANAIADSIAQDPNVLFAEPDAIMQIQQQPPAANDTRFGEQWHYTEPGVSINLPPAWDLVQGNSVVVAVLETGILRHEDIREDLLPGFDFISDIGLANDGDGRDADPTDPGDACPPSRPFSSWHGLHVAGTIAAVTNNEVGVAGIANANILPVRVLGRCGGFLSDIADGILWAAGLPVAGVPDNANPAQVLNLSLGGAGACGPTYADAIRRVRERGVTVVVAAGNSDSDASGFRPANCDGVITAAASNRKGGLALFGGPVAGSIFGCSVDIAAPGGETHANRPDGILSTLNAGLVTAAEDDYEFFQGTSMAAPHVAGVVALLYQSDPEITPDQALFVLQSTSQPFPSVSTRPCDTGTCGGGILDAEAAVSAVLNKARATSAQ
jgi:serine protease